MDTCESGEGDEKTMLPTSSSVNDLSPRNIQLPEEERSPFVQSEALVFKENDRFIHRDLRRRTGAIVFSSSRGNERSYESRAIQGGYFSWAIQNALTNKDADTNSDGQIDTDELRFFVQTQVSAKTEGRQNPVVDKDNIYQKISFALP